MLVNTTKIRALKPCQDRLDNYLNHHYAFSGTMAKFLDLPRISHEDKVWVFLRLVDPRIAVNAAADMAKRVLPRYERQYPNDLRPRKAIEAVRLAAKGKKSGIQECAWAAETSALNAYGAANNARCSDPTPPYEKVCRLYAAQGAADAAAWAAHAASSAYALSIAPARRPAALTIAITSAANRAATFALTAVLVDSEEPVVTGAQHLREQRAQVRIMKKWAKRNPKSGKAK